MHSSKRSAPPRQTRTQLAALLGKDWRTYIPTGSVDRSDVDAFLTKYRDRHSWQDTGTDRKMLAVGADAWTLPVPLKKDAKGWHYDRRRRCR